MYVYLFNSLHIVGILCRKRGHQHTYDQTYNQNYITYSFI